MLLVNSSQTFQAREIAGWYYQKLLPDLGNSPDLMKSDNVGIEIKWVDIRFMPNQVYFSRKAEKSIEKSWGSPTGGGLADLFGRSSPDGPLLRS